MKVFITGATGLTGAHTALALLRAQHEVVLLVRNYALAENYFAKQGYANSQAIHYVIGDMCDKALVKNAMQDCDAVVHAAAYISLDVKEAENIYNTNVNSIDSVISSACELGIKRIVYVSSLGVFFQRGLNSIDESTPLANHNDAYLRSKKQSEVLVRQLQSQGYPIQTTYPSGIYGPDDPKLNEANQALITFLSVMPITSTGLQCVDARDLAEIHRFLLAHPPEDNFENYRFIAAGHYHSWKELHGIMCDLTGRKIFSPRVSGGVLRQTGKVIDKIKCFIPVETPITEEAMEISTCWTEASSNKLLSHAQFDFRPVKHTFGDTLKWLVDADYVAPGKVGRLI